MDEDRQREYRAEKFAINITPVRHQYLYDDEIQISVTHNGHQWSSLSLTRKETKTLVKAIKDYYKDSK